MCRKSVAASGPSPKPAFAYRVLAKLLPGAASLGNSYWLALILFEPAGQQAPEIGVFQRGPVHGSCNLLRLRLRNHGADRDVLLEPLQQSRLALDACRHGVAGLLQDQRLVA